MNRPYEPFDARRAFPVPAYSGHTLSGIPDQWLVHQIDTVHWFSSYPSAQHVVAAAFISGKTAVKTGTQ